MSRPRIAITMGDAAGVGPEVIMKALAHSEVYAQCRPLVVGDARRLERAGGIVGVRLAVRPIATPDEARYEPGIVDCIDLAAIPETTPFGKLSMACGDAAYRFIERATALARAGEVDAICTAPINKEALNAAGHYYPGHTELLAELTGTAEVSLMLMAPGLRVIHVTTHIGLLDAIERIDAGLVERTIARGRELLQRAGRPSRASRSAASIRTRARAGSSAAARRRRRSRPQSKRAGTAAGRSRGHCPPTPFSIARAKATSI